MESIAGLDCTLAEKENKSIQGRWRKTLEESRKRHEADFLFLVMFGLSEKP